MIDDDSLRDTRSRHGFRRGVPVSAAVRSDAQGLSTTVRPPHPRRAHHASQLLPLTRRRFQRARPSHRSERFELAMFASTLANRLDRRGSFDDEAIMLPAILLIESMPPSCWYRL